MRLSFIATLVRAARNAQHVSIDGSGAVCYGSTGALQHGGWWSDVVRIAYCEDCDGAFVTFERSQYDQTGRSQSGSTPWSCECYAG